MWHILIPFLLKILHLIYRTLHLRYLILFQLMKCYYIKFLCVYVRTSGWHVNYKYYKKKLICKYIYFYNRYANDWNCNYRMTFFLFSFKRIYYTSNINNTTYTYCVFEWILCKILKELNLNLRSRFKNWKFITKQTKKTLFINHMLYFHWTCPKSCELKSAFLYVCEFLIFFYKKYVSKSIICWWNFA